MTCERAPPFHSYFMAHNLLFRIDDFEDRPDSRSLQTEIEILRLEENTWGLLQALMSSVSSILCIHSTCT